MDVRTVSVVAVLLGTAAFAIYEYFFSNEGNHQQQQRPYAYENPRDDRVQIRTNNSRTDRLQQQGRRRSNRTKDGQDDCTICLTTLLSGNLITTNCDHQFHHKCLAQWLQLKQVCPICRSPLSRINHI